MTAIEQAPEPSATFEPHRRRLLGLAYRMLGSIAEAEDAVQDAYVRWHAVDRARVSDPKAFLMTTTTRIADRQVDVGAGQPRGVRRAVAAGAGDGHCRSRARQPD